MPLHQHAVSHGCDAEPARRGRRSRRTRERTRRRWCFERAGQIEGRIRRHPWVTRPSTRGAMFSPLSICSGKNGRTESGRPRTSVCQDRESQSAASLVARAAARNGRGASRARRKVSGAVRTGGDVFRTRRRNRQPELPRSCAAHSAMSPAWLGDERRHTFRARYLVEPCERGPRHRPLPRRSPTRPPPGDEAVEVRLQREFQQVECSGEIFFVAAFIDGQCQPREAGGLRVRPGEFRPVRGGGGRTAVEIRASIRPLAGRPRLSGVESGARGT